MPRFTLAASIAALLLGSQNALGAAIVRRDDPTTSLTLPSVTAAAPSDAPTATLEPIVPPAVDPNLLEILKPSKDVTLAFGGETTPGNSLKRSVASRYTLAKVEATLVHPSVPLDHSNFIRGLKCSGGNTLAASFTTKNIYTYAKQQWAGITNLVLISGSRSCAPSSGENVYFQVTSISFDDSTSSFIAKGASLAIKDVAATVKVDWGSTTPSQLRRRSPDGGLYARDYNKTISGTIPFDALLLDNGWSVDEDAPWDNAVLLKSWNTDGSNGEEEGEGEEGEGEGGASLALSLYCVDCGARADFHLSGTALYQWLPYPALNSLYADMNADMYAGMFLGLDMKAEYTNTWEHNIISIPFTPFDLVGIISVGPYVKVGIEASIEVEAEGKILIGASASWNALHAHLDILEPDSSYIEGGTPELVRKAEADVDLSVTATMGAPIEIGCGIDVAGGYWSWGLGLIDTPAIEATAEFEASYNIDDGGSVGNDDCPGIDWKVDLINELAFSVTDITSIGLTTWSSDPLATGCITISSPEVSATPTPSSSPASKSSASPSSTPTSTVTPSSTPSSTPNEDGTTSSTTTSPTSSPTTTTKTKKTKTSKPTTTTTTTSPTKKTKTSKPTTTTTTTSPTKKTTTTKPTKTSTPTTITTTTKKTSTTTTHHHKTTATPALACAKPRHNVDVTAARCASHGCGLDGNVKRLAYLENQGSQTECAAQCLAHAGCGSFGYNASNGHCRLYAQTLAQLPAHKKRCLAETPMTYANPGCYVPTACVR